MLKKLTAFLMTGVLAASALGDYAADRQAAADLAKTDRQEAALAAFVRLAQSADSQIQKSDALEQAALCAANLKQYDTAMGLARQIPVEGASKTVQMSLLSRQQKWLEIVETYRDEKIDAWPDAQKGPAYHIRGLAAYFVKDTDLAEGDLKKAVELLTDDNSKGLAQNSLGDTYRDLLHDNAKAVQTYRGTYETKNPYKRAQASISIAGILTSEKKYDEAIHELQAIKLDQMQVPYWHAKVLIAYADTYKALGKKDDAIAAYSEALKVKDLRPDQKADCERGLKDLLGDAK